MASQQKRQEESRQEKANLKLDHLKHGFGSLAQKIRKRLAQWKEKHKTKPGLGDGGAPAKPKDVADALKVNLKSFKEAVASGALEKSAKQTPAAKTNRDKMKAANIALQRKMYRIFNHAKRTIENHIIDITR